MSCVAEHVQIADVLMPACLEKAIEAAIDYAKEGASVKELKKTIHLRASLPDF